MNTETTETIKGWVFYDGECAFCRGWIDRSYAVLVRRGFHPMALQAEWAKSRLGIKGNEPLTEMKFLTRDGFLYGGADALIQMARRIWWLWPVFAVAQVPGVKAVARRLYRRLAANRHCFGGACAIRERGERRPGSIASAFYELP